jgi:hypothetical protein
MRYCIDTEFWERPGHINWISIGIVREDGKEFYAENSNFPWNWLEQCAKGLHEQFENPDTPKWLLENVRPHLRGGDALMDTAQVKEALGEFTLDSDYVIHGKQPKFWAWYGAYDWVVFCWLFGRMIDLPEHFPMYVRDFRHVCEQYDIRGKDLAPAVAGTDHDALADARRLDQMIREFESRYTNFASPRLVHPLA